MQHILHRKTTNTHKKHINSISSASEIPFLPVSLLFVTVMRGDCWVIIDVYVMAVVMAIKPFSSSSGSLNAFTQSIGRVNLNQFLTVYKFSLAVNGCNAFRLYFCFYYRISLYLWPLH